MNIDTIAAQLKTYALLFNGNVAGAAAYANGVADQVWLPYPAAYVIPLDEDAEPNEDWSGLQQIVKERVGVIVVLETNKVGGALDVADRRGQAASAYLRTVRSAIFSAILNWHPDRAHGLPPNDIEGRGLYYVGGMFPADFDRARFFYQFTFGLDVTITDGDGFQYSGDPLTDVTGVIQPGGTLGIGPDITFSVTLEG